MRLPRVRFTVRSLMLAVALVAVLIAGGSLARWSRDHLLVAAAFARMEREALGRAEMGDRWVAARRAPGGPPGEATSWRRESDYDRSLAAWHRRMGGRYGRAAWRPWESVPPEPPPPHPEYGVLPERIINPLPVLPPAPPGPPRFPASDEPLSAD